MSLAYVLDEIFAEHRPPGPHPERPERIAAVRDALRAAGLAERGSQIPIREADESEIGLVHTAGYLADLIREVPDKSGWIDGDTYFSPGTWRAALAAVGAVLDATLAVLDGEHDRALAVIRPPGHHAEADRAMGFCLFNNVAIAAAAARAKGAARVAIVDWDVHHGNGTQHIFEADPTVMFQSCHQYPFYPGTGAGTEIGRGEGRGATVNVALPGGCGDREYIAVMNEVLVPELRRFAPDIILLSAGFDAHRDDPLAQMRVTANGYRAMADALVAAANELCDGRVVCALEGGYDLGGLGSGMAAVLEAFTAPGCPEAGAGGVAEQASNPPRSGSPGGPEERDPSEHRARGAIERTLGALRACREDSR